MQYSVYNVTAVVSETLTKIQLEWAAPKINQQIIFVLWNIKYSFPQFNNILFADVLYYAWDFWENRTGTDP